MKLLEEKILAEGKAENENILKVDSFINHQVDPMLMEQLGAELASHFKDCGVTKVVTIESSGIAPALMTAKALGVPMIILKKAPSKILNQNLFQTVVTSYTKGTSYELTIKREFLDPGEKVLFIDDFLASGEAAFGMLRLAKEAGIEVAGIGIVIEKAFQAGHDRLIGEGIDVYSLARVKSMSENHIEFVD